MPPIPPDSLPVATVLTVAGSDPSGGAGIQADLKTFAAIGVYGGAVITSLTVQNTMGVRQMTPLPPALVKAQLSEVLVDLTVSHVKIGMVASAAIGAAIGEALRNFAGEVIYDPVLRATSGRSLFAEEGLAALQQELINRVTVLTPNLPELTALTSISPADGDLASAAALLFDRYPRLRALVVTGGHDEREAATVTDRLFLRPPHGSSPICLANSHPRVKTTNCHGTGCTFASAFAAYHQQSNDYREAFTKAIGFVDQLLRLSSAYRVGHGNGPLLHHLWQR